jgi:TRAP-type C4-dicarboxylate transport system substrate-binding protein
MADEWRKITDGMVNIRIYPGGIAGNESDMVRKMRFGQLDIGIFSAFGLNEIVPETLVLTFPGLITEEDVLDAVLENFSSGFEESFEDAGFELLSWFKSGWAYLYAESPIRTPEELMNVKLALWNENGVIAEALRSLGFKISLIDLNETLMALQSGMADAYFAPPMVSAGLQWFAFADYMTDFQMMPVIGGMVITGKTWDRIPEKYHEALKLSMNKFALEYYSQLHEIDIKALDIMKENGLNVISLNKQEISGWKSVMKEGTGMMVGDGLPVSEELFSRITAFINNIE